jgi:hypothetical protein
MAGTEPRDAATNDDNPSTTVFHVRHSRFGFFELFNNWAFAVMILRFRYRSTG